MRPVASLEAVSAFEVLAGSACAAQGLSCHSGTDADAYRALARRWAGSVTVVTMRHGADAECGPFDGVTATAFLTVSIDPPIVLVSLSRMTKAATALATSSGFVVNLLAEDQEIVSRRFAGSSRDRSSIAWERISTRRDARGVPVLDGTVGAFSADVREVLDSGDHILLLGNVSQIWLGASGTPLVYCDRAYARLEAI